MRSTPLAELEYYDVDPTILTGYDAETFVMEQFSYEMSNDIGIVYISGTSRAIYVGEEDSDQNQPMWDAYEYAKQYPDSKVL